MRRRDVLAAGMATLSLALTRSLPASAQSRFPDQTIKMVVPRSAGGVVDVVARIWAEQVKGDLGTVLIENLGGGGGTIAATGVARAKPDGHTLLAGTTSELVISPVIMSRPPYDPVKDLTPVVMTAVSVSALMVHESVPAKTLQEFIAYAKANSGKLSYGSAGVGTSAHLCAELFKQLSGLHDIVHVPYKGANPGLADFYSGHLPMFAASISPQVLDMHRQGKIRILVAGSPKRLQGAPDIPISAEVGFPDLITLMFMGVFAPAGTPRTVIDQIAAASHRAMADPDVQAKLIKAGFEPVLGMGPEDTAKFVQDELVRWTPLLKVSGIKIN
jgi:tripartite-type tricarboxylate transporter receptor subunit TctC